MTPGSAGEPTRRPVAGRGPEAVTPRPDSAAGPAPGPVPGRALGLWEGYGIEIETMIVDARSLDVRPVADRLFELHGWAPETEVDEVGGGESETADGDASPRIDAASDLVVDGVGWSNEVALHVLELKTTGPVPTLRGVARSFQKSLDRANAALEALGCRLLPGGMHPWMDPEKEFRIWPHEYSEVYRAFDRIFGCRGHGWSNLQSAHLNLPFSDDREFALLHEAIRLVLPLIPALAASSPVMEGRVGPALDNRMAAYREHARKVPSLVGSVVPECIRSRAEYEDRILAPIYRDLTPLDPRGILRHEWVNARGAIAHFGRGSVEIRVIDAQESPRMDLAVVAAVTAAVRRAVGFLESEGEPVLGSPASRSSGATDDLARILDRTVRDGRRAIIDPGDQDLYRRVLGLRAQPDSAGAVWEGFLEEADVAEWRESLEIILREGSLAERILRDLDMDRPGSSGEPISRAPLEATYRRLADTLAEGGAFRP